MIPILKAEGLTYRAGDRTLINDASLELTSGRMAIIIGPNGAGKSTLLRLLAGEHKPRAGMVCLLGMSLREFRPSRLACIRAVLSQGATLALPFTVREVASLGLEGIGRSLSRSDKDATVRRALETADVAHLAGRSIQTLSGGERQRTHFARILCQLAAGRTLESRQIAFFDEPIANLDLSHQLDLLDAVAALAADGVAVVVVIHDLNLAAAYADDLIVLDRGRIVANGAPVDVITNTLLSEVFRLQMRVSDVPNDAGPFILPVRRRPLPQSKNGRASLFNG
jgi:iron complex transport system ATP-binding protein